MNDVILWGPGEFLHPVDEKGHIKNSTDQHNSINSFAVRRLCSDEKGAETAELRDAPASSTWRVLSYLCGFLFYFFPLLEEQSSISEEAAAESPRFPVSSIESPDFSKCALRREHLIIKLLCGWFSSIFPKVRLKKTKVSLWCHIRHHFHHDPYTIM